MDCVVIECFLKFFLALYRLSRDTVLVNFTMIRGGLFVDVSDLMRKAESMSPGKMYSNSLCRPFSD